MRKSLPSKKTVMSLNPQLAKLRGNKKPLADQYFLLFAFINHSFSPLIYDDSSDIKSPCRVCVLPMEKWSRSKMRDQRILLYLDEILISQRCWITVTHGKGSELAAQSQRDRLFPTYFTELNPDQKNVRANPAQWAQSTGPHSDCCLRSPELAGVFSWRVLNTGSEVQICPTLRSQISCLYPRGVKTSSWPSLHFSWSALSDAMLPPAALTLHHIRTDPSPPPHQKERPPRLTQDIGI